MLDLIISDISEPTTDSRVTKEYVIDYLEYALLKKCQSTEIFRTFPELENEMKRYCDVNDITYIQFTQFFINMILHKLYPTHIMTHKFTNIHTHKPTPAPTHVSSSSILKTNVKSNFAVVIVLLEHVNLFFIF